MKITVKVLKSFGKFNPGDTVTVKCDAKGVPLSQEWRRRISDSEFDGCCEIKQQPKPKLKRTEER